MGTKVVEKELRYIKKPIPVEAIQWTGNNFPEMRAFMHDAHTFITMHNELVIPTLEGEMRAAVGSYIVRGIEGEYYPCRQDIFEKTYEPMEE